MAYVCVIAPCVRCHLPVHCNPTRVPSVRLKPDGPREPVCASCVAVLNGIRVKAGMEPIPILPGAYEAEDENLIDWN